MFSKKKNGFVPENSGLAAAGAKLKLMQTSAPCKLVMSPKQSTAMCEQTYTTYTSKQPCNIPFPPFKQKSSVVSSREYVKRETILE